MRLEPPSRLRWSEPVVRVKKRSPPPLKIERGSQSASPRRGPIFLLLPAVLFLAAPTTSVHLSAARSGPPAKVTKIEVSAESISAGNAGAPLLTASGYIRRPPERRWSPPRSRAVFRVCASRRAVGFREGEIIARLERPATTWPRWNGPRLRSSGRRRIWPKRSARPGSPKASRANRSEPATRSTAPTLASPSRSRVATGKGRRRVRPGYLANTEIRALLRHGREEDGGSGRKRRPHPSGREHLNRFRRHRGPRRPRYARSRGGRGGIECGETRSGPARRGLRRSVSGPQVPRPSAPGHPHRRPDEGHGPGEGDDPRQGQGPQAPR